MCENLTSPLVIRAAHINNSEHKNEIAQGALIGSDIQSTRSSGRRGFVFNRVDVSSSSLNMHRMRDN